MKKLMLLLVLLMFSMATAQAQRGCCSWHGGVAGCQYGRVVCNDGTYSPTCMCELSQPQSETSSVPTVALMTPNPDLADLNCEDSKDAQRIETITNN